MLILGLPVRIGPVSFRYRGPFQLVIALVLENLRILGGVHGQRKADLPILGERLRIGYVGFVGNGRGTSPGESLYRMKLIAVVIAGHVEPSLVIEVDRVHYERVAVPASAGI